MLKNKHIPKHGAKPKKSNKAPSAKKSIFRKVEPSKVASKNINLGEIKIDEKKIILKTDDSKNAKSVSKVAIKTTSKNNKTSTAKIIQNKVKSETADSRLNSFFSQISSKKTYISVGSLVLLVGLTAFFSVRENARLAISNYENAVYEININTEDQVKSASNSYYSLSGSLIVDDSISSSFKDAADGTKRALLAMQTLNPPEKYIKNHLMITKSYREISKTYSGLVNMSSYFASRNKYLEDIGTYSSSMISKVDSTFKRAEVVGIGTSASMHIKSDYTKLRLISTKAADKDVILLRYLSNLNSDIKELDLSLEKRNRTKIKGSLEIISQEYVQNWAKVFLSDEEKKISLAGKNLSKTDGLLKIISAFTSKEI